MINPIAPKIINVMPPLSKSEQAIRAASIGVRALADEQQVLRYVINVGDAVKNKLDALYPRGCVLASVGRSPSLLAKYLELQGKEVKYCPISDLKDLCNSEQIPSGFLIEYRKFLDRIGLTDKFIKETLKPIVFTDYTFQGLSLRNFELMLKRIGIFAGPKVHFRPINGNIYGLPGILQLHTEDKALNHSVTQLLTMRLGKKYTPIPRLPWTTQPSEVSGILNSPPSAASKRMNDLMTDFLEHVGRLSPLYK